jgi:hypothetical protein
VPPRSRFGDRREPTALLTRGPTGIGYGDRPELTAHSGTGGTRFGDRREPLEIRQALRADHSTRGPTGAPRTVRGPTGIDSGTDVHEGRGPTRGAFGDGQEIARGPTGPDSGTGGTTSRTSTSISGGYARKSRCKIFLRSVRSLIVSLLKDRYLAAPGPLRPSAPQGASTTPSQHSPHSRKGPSIPLHSRWGPPSGTPPARAPGHKPTDQRHPWGGQVTGREHRGSGPSGALRTAQPPRPTRLTRLPAACDAKRCPSPQGQGSEAPRAGRGSTRK